MSRLGYRDHSVSMHMKYVISLLFNLVALICILEPSVIVAQVVVAQGHKDARTIVQLREDADPGDANAMVLLGEHYRDAVDPDFDRAISWFRKAIDRGDLSAMSSMGWMYFHGLGVEKDVGQALKWYRTAAEAGGHEGMNNLGHLYLHGAGVKQDVQEAIRWFRKSSAAGNPYGYDNLGVLYLEGNGLPQNVEAAKEMFRSAADLGLTDSMIRIGRIERAHDSPESRKAAFDWFSRAQASMEGMKEIGDCYFDGIGVEPGTDEGLRWYQLAIDAGHPLAPADLADRLLSGRGVSIDREKAMTVLETAASNGNIGAVTKLGHIASESKDYEQALEYYRVAAERGEATAMLCIAIQYQNGWGVQKDLEQALNWLQKAADHGSEMAAQILAKVEN